MACKYYYFLFIIGRVSNENKTFMLNLKKNIIKGVGSSELIVVRYCSKLQFLK